MPGRIVLLREHLKIAMDHEVTAHHSPFMMSSNPTSVSPPSRSSRTGSIKVTTVGTLSHSALFVYPLGNSYLGLPGLQQHHQLDVQTVQLVHRIFDLREVLQTDKLGDFVTLRIYLLFVPVLEHMYSLD